MSDRIELKSVGDILGMNFYIPKYQRGYRWTKQQVIDLLNDIKEFMEREPGDDEIYCLQPLVIKKKDDDTFKRIKEEAQNLIEVEALLKGLWDVIDGQQRLTTIKILLSCLDEKESYNIEYETREGSKDFLSKISNTSVKKEDNIDFYHMNQANETIQTWLRLENNDNPSFKETFKETLLNNVKFIWYKSTDEDPIKVFTRLNIGKIPLTDAELIKALFLNQSNFSDGENEENIRFYQQEIAAEWDNIEYTLQNDEFWLFIHSLGWDKPTRIDFIFDLMREKNVLQISDEQYKRIGEDEHKTFRYFYEYFKAEKKTIDGSKLRDEIWRKVKEYFQIFQEWYNDLELYHYVGYLVDRGDISTLQTLLCEWKGKSSKDLFEDYLIDQIKGKLNKCSSLTRKYGDTGENKTECLPLLLLFNIQTVINQNKELVNSDKYGVGTFYKFPFHLFKKEGKKVNGKGWEIEHIASNAGDNLTKLENKKIFFASIKYSFELEEGLKAKINRFIKNGKEDDFEVLHSEVCEKCESLTSIPDDKKNYIWNFALLDSTTNEEYQNAPFPVKRICVLAKEQGKKAKLGLNENNELKITYENGIAFVPLCTRNVFTKAYTEIPTALNAWALDDAEHYLKKINEVLCGAGFISDQKDEIENLLKDPKSMEKNNG